MNLTILCSTKLDKTDIEEIDAYATANHMTREEVVRLAVKNYSDECVPTHLRRAKAQSK